MYRTGLANGVMSCDIRCARPVQVQCNVMVWGSGSVMIRSLWSMSHVRNKIRIEGRMERMPSLVRSNPLGIGDGVPYVLGIEPWDRTHGLEPSGSNSLRARGDSATRWMYWTAAIATYVVAYLCPIMLG